MSGDDRRDGGKPETANEEKLWMGSGESPGTAGAEASGSASGEAPGTAGAEASGTSSAEASGTVSGEAPGTAGAEASGTVSGEASGTVEAPAAPADGTKAQPSVRRPETDEEKAARRKAALEAREAAKAAAAQGAARPAAAPGAAGGAASAAGEAAAPKPPSPNQPLLDRVVQLLRELAGEDAVEEASINEPNDHLPTLVVKAERWPACAKLLRSHPELNLNYLRNVAGVDQETHMEVVYHLLSLDSGRNYAVKVRTDRDRPQVPSVTPIWPTANWNEREIYDLLGIDFPGHPDLRRIMMPDDWVGHPLRKDYVPLDPEV